MRKLQITEGEAFLDSGDQKIVKINTVDGSLFACKADMYGYYQRGINLEIAKATALKDKKEVERHRKYLIDFEQEDYANVKLIADAFNTANKCDMLPSELLEQRDKLLKLLKDVYLKNQQLSNASVSFAVHTDNERAMMRNLISKCSNVDALDLQIEIETGAIEHKIEL